MNYWVPVVLLLFLFIYTVRSFYIYKQKLIFLRLSRISTTDTTDWGKSMISNAFYLS